MINISTKLIGMKFVMKNGRMGKIVGINYDFKTQKPKNYRVRAVGRNKLRNLYSYAMRAEFLFKNVVMWFSDDEIKIMYKEMQYQDKTGKKVNGISKYAIKHKRIVRYL